MPPLSDYTPFESLLFFQSLATLDARPASFVTISDKLRSNPFIRHNVAFNADRLAPEALEDLYSTLTRDGLDVAAVVSSSEQNGHRADSPGSGNPKKRKISSPRPEGLVDKGVAHARMVPDLVSHLYAKYKELVTREIRNEEKRYKDIRDEIERLQKEERQVPEPAPVQIVPPVAQVKPERVPAPASPPPPAPEPMDVDVKEEKPVQPPVQEVAKPAQPAPPVVPAQRPAEPQQQKEVKAPQPPAKTPALPAVPPPPTQPVGQPQAPVENGQQQKQQPKQFPPPQSKPQPTQPQPVPQIKSGQPPQPVPVNGKQPLPPPPSNLTPRPAPPTPSAKGPTTPQVPPPAALTANNGSARNPAAPLSQAPPGVHAPVTAPPPPVPAAKSTTKGAPPIPAPAAAPQKLPPQPSFQQWPLNPAPQTPRPSIPSHATPKNPNQAPAGRPIPSPFPPPAAQTNTPKPYQGPYPLPPATPGPVSAAVPSHAPGHGLETPIGAAQALFSESRRSSRPPRLSIDTPGPTTPWKRTPRLSIPQSPGSPPRPRPEDVSPISERAPSLEPFEPLDPVEATESQRRKRRPAASRERADDKKTAVSTKTEKSTQSARKKRAGSTTSSRSRGRSVLSRDEESPADSQTRIKHEMPTTPAGVPEVPEMEYRNTSGRRGATASSQTEDRPARGRPKRKRAPSEAEPEPLHSELSRLDSTQYVLCARNFPRTGAPIMNDVTMHKHASIFAKPLAERDAPGYRDLIYRPQDLKSIKSSIHQGSKGVAAATEAANTPVADGESPAPNAGTPSKNTVLILQKAEDIIPPKGIVNSAQLEKELIRMFANAIMFNPVPQRGFGPAFPMISDSGSRESTLVPEADEGGIIKDTQEMFYDVEQAVTRWRAAERTADELATKSVLSLRRGSASDFNTDSADEVKG